MMKVQILNILKCEGDKIMQKLTDEEINALIKHINNNMNIYNRDIDYKIKRSDRIEINCMKVSRLEELRAKKVKKVRKLKESEVNRAKATGCLVSVK